MGITEAELKAAAIGPRVSLDQVNAAIGSEHYFSGLDAMMGVNLGEPQIVPSALGTLTFCTLVLKNGYVVHGHSACASPENYNKDIGETIARENAVRQIWPLLGYQLKSELALVEEATPLAGRMKEEFQGNVYLGTKVVNATLMSRGVYNALRGWTVPSSENPEDEGYLVEYTDGQTSNLVGFTGYVSWSPKEVFEKAYRQVGSKVIEAKEERNKPDTWQDRLKNEIMDVTDRMKKLRTFAESSPSFMELPAEDQSLLLAQYDAMARYLKIMIIRAHRAGLDA